MLLYDVSVVVNKNTISTDNETPDLFMHKIEKNNSIPRQDEV